MFRLVVVLALCWMSELFPAGVFAILKCWFAVVDNGFPVVVIPGLSPEGILQGFRHGVPVSYVVISVVHSIIVL